MGIYTFNYWLHFRFGIAGGTDGWLTMRYITQAAGALQVHLSSGRVGPRFAADYCQQEFGEGTSCFEENHLVWPAETLALMLGSQQL